MLAVRRITALLLLCFSSFAAHAADGEFVWARSMGGTAYDQGSSIAVDVAGNVYTTGLFQATSDFDPSPEIFNLASRGRVDVFVQKVDRLGNLVWARSVGGIGQDYGNGIALDTEANVYVTGYYKGTVDFDPGEGTYNLTSKSESEVFVLKLDSSGNFVWAKSTGGRFNDVPNGIAVDGAGNVYITGSFYGTVDFDPGTDTYNLTNVGEYYIYVQKLDSSGNLAWARNMGGLGFCIGKGIAVDGVGNVYTTGNYVGLADFDPGEGIFSMTSAGGYDIFVQKLDSKGKFMWARGMGGRNSEDAYGITVDGASSIYTTGILADTADFDPGVGTLNLTSAGWYDIFVQKMDTSGNLVWARSIGGSDYDFGSGIAVDGTGNVFTTGEFAGNVDFDPGESINSLTSAGLSDGYILKLDTHGEFAWVRRMGGSGSVRGIDLAVDGTSKVYTTGYFAKITDFDPGPDTYNLTSAGSADIFVQKLLQDSTPPNTTAIAPFTTGPINADSVSFTVTFDEDVQNFNDAVDLVTTHDGMASTGATISGGALEYTVTLSGISGDGSFTLAVNLASDVQDLVGNALATSVTSAAVVIDNTAPNVSIGAPIGSPVNSGATATFPVNLDGASSVNLTSGDVMIHHLGTSGGSVVVVDGTTANPTVQVGGVSGDGNYSISIAAGIAGDAAGNTSPAAGPSAAVRVDNRGPEFGNVVASPAEVSVGDTVSISFDSSEPVAGEPDVTVNGNPAMRTVKADFAYEYTVQSRDVLGAATITISGADALGNVGAFGDSTLLDIVRAEGEGDVEGEGEGGSEGEGVSEGTQDGEGEGIVEGAGDGEGEGENPPAGCGGCNANSAPMERALGDWLAVFFGFAVLLGAHLSMRSRLEG